MKILICGNSGEGKSTIAKLIIDTLTDNGILVSSIKDDYNPIDDRYQKLRLKTLSERLKVEIESVQTIKK